jgi:hypothetical protein
MAGHPPRRVLAPVLVSLPACGSVGGGLTELCHGGGLTAVLVAVAPTVVCLPLLWLAYRSEIRRYVTASPAEQRAMREFVDMVVALLTLTRTRDDGPDPGGRGPQRGSPGIPSQRRGHKQEGATRREPRGPSRIEPNRIIAPVPEAIATARSPR